jgi:hypothetical protein
MLFCELRSQIRASPCFCQKPPVVKLLYVCSRQWHIRILKRDLGYRSVPPVQQMMSLR